MECVGHDDISVINFIKSARVGATKIMLAAVAYFASHKFRNQLFYQPTNDDSKEFVQTEVNPMIRDVPAVQSVFPSFGRKTSGNTDNLKQFTTSKLVLKGGTAAGNYRRLSTDVVYYDELENFHKDVEGEGDPLTLGDKRAEGSYFKKSVRMTTPKTKNNSLIEKAVEQSGHLFKFHVPCPHCQKEQVLEWGGPDAKFGLKWDGKDASTVYYECIHCHEKIGNHQLTFMNDNGVFRDQHGNWIDLSEIVYFENGSCVFLKDDGQIRFRDKNNQLIKAPRRVSFHIWTIYSPFTTWEQIVQDFLDAMDLLKTEQDNSKLKTFINTTLGETFSEDDGEQLDWEQLYNRREAYPAKDDVLLVPKRARKLMGFIDVQGDRFEMGVYGFALDRENFLIDYRVQVGNLDQPRIWDIVEEAIFKTYKREDGAQMSVEWGIDSGGNYTKETYEFVKRIGAPKIYACKGSSDYDHEIFRYPRDLNKYGVRLIMIGTKQIKDSVYNMLSLTTDDPTVPTPGYCHFPLHEIADKNYFKQLCAEEKVQKRHKGKWVWAYDNFKRRNEALDIFCGANVMLGVHEKHHGLDLAKLDLEVEKPPLSLADIAKGLSQ